MKHILCFDHSELSRERSRVIHEALYLAPALLAGKESRSTELSRHLLKVLDKFDSISVENGDTYGAGQDNQRAREIVNRADLILEGPEYDLVVKYLDALVQHARTGKLRACLDTLDWVIAASHD